MIGRTVIGKYLKYLSASLLIPLAFSGVAYAGGEVIYDYATVVSAEPQYKTVRYATPREECWQEEVVHEQRSQGHSPTGSIVGGIVGAAIGHELGHHKRNKQVGAVAGAVLGASVGRDLSRKHHSQNSGRRYVTSEERCEVVNEYHEEERVMGYNVTYQYHGQLFHAQTKNHPGEEIKIRLQMTPML